MWYKTNRKLGHAPEYVWGYPWTNTEGYSSTEIPANLAGVDPVELWEEIHNGRMRLSDEAVELIKSKQARMFKGRITDGRMLRNIGNSNSFPDFSGVCVFLHQAGVDLSKAIIPEPGPKWSDD